MSSAPHAHALNQDCQIWVSKLAQCPTEHQNSKHATPRPKIDILHDMHFKSLYRLVVIIKTCNMSNLCINMSSWENNNPPSTGKPQNWQPCSKHISKVQAHVIIISVMIYYSYAFIWGEETLWTTWNVLTQLVRSQLLLHCFT